MYDLIKTTPSSSALETVGSASQEGTEKWKRRAGQQAHTWDAGASHRTIMYVGVLHQGMGCLHCPEHRDLMRSNL